MRAGIIVGAVNFAVIVALGLFAGDLGVVQASYLGVINGIISSIFAIGSLAYLESLFGITSAIKLLELSNPNHPLLKRLLIEAPGTYHHSIMVGNLAEAAAEAVGGDPLLSRVGAYYHDIGKVKRPYFFAENQFAGENPHDKIAPGLSTLIITTHVKDGVELAKEHRLPDVVVDLIRQHHGTDLVRYFFHRAKENGRENLSERDFRYSGPKPQSKETAIVMIVDSVEAAFRVVSSRDEDSIRDLVTKIANRKMQQGELDRSGLTIGELKKITDTLTHILKSSVHQRIAYPEKTETEEKPPEESKGSSVYPGRFGQRS
jgi:putative nucleotidyltransferase with HDIG domain